MDAENPESYTAQIADVVSRLSFSSYFSEEEQETLRKFFIEQDLTEETFVTSETIDGDADVSTSIAETKVEISESSVVKIDLTEQFEKNMYVLSGGKISIASETPVAADIVRGTLEVQDSNEFVMSAYTGSISAGDTTAESGMITISGTLTSLSDDVKTVDDDGIESLEGTSIIFTVVSASLFLT